jgi:hypothetical protein
MDHEGYKIQPRGMISWRSIDVRSLVDEIQRAHRCRVEVAFHADKGGISVFYNGNRTDYRGSVIWALGGPSESHLGYYQETFTEPELPARLCYEVQFGYMCRQSAKFATFAEALAFLRGYNEARDVQYSNAPRIVNTDNIDGADDASPAAQHGLTADEWERVQEVG